MNLSARNQLTGTITDLKLGPVSSEVTIDINGVPIVASITTASAEALNLKVGEQASAVIKASSVMIGK